MEIKGRVVAVYFEKDNVFLKVELDEEFQYIEDTDNTGIQKISKFIFLKITNTNIISSNGLFQLQGKKIEANIKKCDNCGIDKKFKTCFEIEWIGVI